MEERELGYIYLALLRHPFDAWRVENQPLYAAIRDRLADMRGETPEETQTFYEGIA